jgi:hypothetical protein
VLSAGLAYGVWIFTPTSGPIFFGPFPVESLLSNVEESLSVEMFWSLSLESLSPTPLNLLLSTPSDERRRIGVGPRSTQSRLF